MCGDYLAKFLHDEDSHFGLNVQNEKGERWRCYGDERYGDPENKRNRELCEAAVQLSIQEIYQAYQNKDGTPVYGALKLAPDLAKARDRSTNADHRVLFFFDSAGLQRRQDVNNLKDNHYAWCSDGLTTVGFLKLHYKLLG
jgi:hypothetical protein